MILLTRTGVVAIRTLTVLSSNPATMIINLACAQAGKRESAKRYLVSREREPGRHAAAMNYCSNVDSATYAATQKMDTAPRRQRGAHGTALAQAPQRNRAPD